MSKRLSVEDFKEGKLYYSKVTEIVYKVENGVLFKFPTYIGAAREWAVAKYKGKQTYFQELTKKDVKDLEIPLERSRP